MKKQDYLKWDEYFMGIAMLSAMRSKDPNTSVGACIVSQDNKILSMGLALACLIGGFSYPFIPLHLTLISALTIGVPSFFLAMEPNYERVSGRFLPTVLGRALPGGLANLLLVLLAQLILPLFSLSDGQISTSCAAILAVVGMFVLRQACKPFDTFRHILWWTMMAGLIFCFTVLRGFFFLTYGAWQSVLFMMTLPVLAPAVYKLLRIGLKKGKKALKKRG